MNPRELKTAPVAPRACNSSHDGSPLHNWSRCTGRIALLAGHVGVDRAPCEMLGVGEVAIQTWRVAHAVRGRTDVHGSVRRRGAPRLIHGDGHLRQTASARECGPRALQMRIRVCWADSERSFTSWTVSYPLVRIHLIRNDLGAHMANAPNE